MSGRPLERVELSSLLEAARWAPSSGNGQPWRFVYAIAGTPDFQRFFDLLAEGNRPWCQRAGALLVVLSKAVRARGEPARTHAFDAGAAWMSLALEGTIRGLVVHGMEGFDYERAHAAVGAPEHHAVQCMIAVGHPGSLDELPERYRAREQPSGREPVSAFSFEGRFSSST
jgi:nitroreductase